MSKSVSTDIISFSCRMPASHSFRALFLFWLVCLLGGKVRVSHKAGPKRTLPAVNPGACVAAELDAEIATLKERMTAAQGRIARVDGERNIGPRLVTRARPMRHVKA